MEIVPQLRILEIDSKISRRIRNYYYEMTFKTVANSVANFYD